MFIGEEKLKLLSNEKIQYKDTNFQKLLREKEYCQTIKFLLVSNQSENLEVEIQIIHLDTNEYDINCRLLNSNCWNEEIDILMNKNIEFFLKHSEDRLRLKMGVKKIRKKVKWINHKIIEEKTFA